MDRNNERDDFLLFWSSVLTLLTRYLEVELLSKTEFYTESPH